jgi:tetratricopeptide (TPR) repeat protein
MSPEEGILFLLRRAQLISEHADLDGISATQRRDAEAIYELVDGLPLALDQVAGYIEENQCSLVDYLTLYQSRHATLLKRRGTFGKHDYPKSVATTWSLSFEQVEQDNRAAAELLRLCAFLHPDSIPETMIVEGASELCPNLQSMVDDPIEFAEAIGALRKYSLVRRNPETKTLTLHRLVQTVLRDGMDKEMQKGWAERAVRVVNKVFPEVQFALWLKCELYLPHAQICTELIEQWELAFPEAAQLLSRVGNYLYGRGQYREAELLYQKTLGIRERILGPEHVDVATDMNNLARLHTEVGKYAQAEALYQRVQGIRERALGPTHPDLAITINHLGSLYREQGKYAQAESLHKQALAIRIQVFGSNHLDVAESLDDLAVVYNDQGKYTGSEELYKQALAIRERLLGPDHPDVATTLNNLGWLYYRQGRFDLAEVPHLRALAISEKGLSPDHPN